MYRIVAKQHKDYVTPFSNGYPILSTIGNWVYIIIGEEETKEIAQKELGNILIKKFDADYHNGSFYINEEKVYNSNDYECIFSGINIWVEKKEIEWSDKWEPIPSPLGSDISIEVKNNDYGYDIKVDDKYLISVNKISYMALELIGRKAFWLDPCALRGEEHTSNWKEIAEVNYEIIIFDDGTEALLDECYM